MARQKRDDSIISSGGEGGTLRSALRTTVDDSNGTDSGAEIETGLPDPVFDGDLLYCSKCDFELEVDPEEGVCVCEVQPGT